MSSNWRLIRRRGNYGHREYCAELSEGVLACLEPSQDVRRHMFSDSRDSTARHSMCHRYSSGSSRAALGSGASVETRLRSFLGMRWVIRSPTQSCRRFDQRGRADARRADQEPFQSQSGLGRIQAALTMLAEHGLGVWSRRGRPQGDQPNVGSRVWKRKGTALCRYHRLCREVNRRLVDLPDPYVSSHATTEADRRADTADRTARIQDATT